MNNRTKLFRTLLAAAMLLYIDSAYAYEVAPSLGSTAPLQATIDLANRSKWPVVADLSWGPLANLYPIALLGSRGQQEAIFNTFKQRKAIAELPYNQIIFDDNSQPAITFIESFGYTVPYVFVLDGSVGGHSMMLSRTELLKVNAKFPDKKIIMNTRSWADDHEYVESIKDLVDGVCIEYFPHNADFNVTKHVAPFAGWAYNNDKILMFLMPPLPDEDNFSYWVTTLARIVYRENSNLPKGWMQSDKFIFSPANYTFGTSSLTYVPEDAKNTVMGAAKALLMLRPELDAGPVYPVIENKTTIAPLLLLLK